VNGSHLNWWLCDSHYCAGACLVCIVYAELGAGSVHSRLVSYVVHALNLGRVLIIRRATIAQPLVVLVDTWRLHLMAVRRL
jgi:hypothetical protein